MAFSAAPSEVEQEVVRTLNALGAEHLKYEENKFVCSLDNAFFDVIIGETENGVPTVRLELNGGDKKKYEEVTKKFAKEIAVSIS